MAASLHGDTPYFGRRVTSGSVTPYTTSVDVNTRRGIQIVPIIRPSGLSALWIRLRYWTIALFAVIVFAGLVSAGLILIGVILISYQQTKDLSGSVHVLLRIPGGAVITRQLLSLSFSLGALAPLFLVAAQRPDDRDRFMKNLLVCHRRAMLVYSIYCRAQCYSGVLTKVHIPRPRDAACMPEGKLTRPPDPY